MTDRNAILAALTEAIRDAVNGTPEAATEAEVTDAIAAAVLELVGPKPLHWMNNGNHWAGGLGWVVRKMGGQYVLTKASRFDQYFPTLEAAKAAAQAHADAAHWANCPLGKLAGWRDE